MTRAPDIALGVLCLLIAGAIVLAGPAVAWPGAVLAAVGGVIYLLIGAQVI